jgi:hypothetical protein
MTCDETYACGGEVTALFSVAVKDWSNEEADDEGRVEIKVCRDCAATGNWED